MINRSATATPKQFANWYFSVAILEAGYLAVPVWRPGWRGQTGDLALGGMRGALFETWVVSELTKYLCNHALPGRLYFWRDNAGNEVDFRNEVGAEVKFV